jgi:thioesterase domain-containing protein/acyl carrier protein
VRMRQQGEFEFLGRTDQQVKLRGFRIELGEIEAVLVRHQAVRRAIAITAETTSGEIAIFAYVDLHGEVAASRDQIVEALRADVAAMLPGYMRPRRIMVLDAIPVLPNGKIDRRSLPLPDLEEKAEPTRLQPLDDLEMRLAQIWSEILGIESVDANSDFFELGGHSLLAARLIARVEAVFGRRVSLSALFESRSITAFANLLRSLPPRDFDFRQIVRMGSAHGEKGIFAINNTGIFLTLSHRLGEHLSITALQLFDPLIKRENLPATVEETAREYVQLIREVQSRGPYALLGWCNGGTLAFETARQLEEVGERVSDVFLIDAWVPGYLENAGWLRSKLASLSYRWGLVMLDWTKVRSGQKSFWDFVADRAIVRRLYRRGQISNTIPEPAYAAAQGYDDWLLDYTNQMRKAYQPKPIAARLTVFRSASEPTGLFLDSKLGWDGMAADGVNLVVVPGDHFTVFKEPGASILANAIEAAIRSDVNDVDYDVIDGIQKP